MLSETQKPQFFRVYGMGFYHMPATDTISLSVPAFRDFKENAKIGLNLDQINFVGFHEFGHLKTMWQCDRAGKHNHLVHYNYEARKQIQDITAPNAPKRFLRRSVSDERCSLEEASGSFSAAFGGTAEA